MSNHKLFYPNSEAVAKDLGNGATREILSHSGGLMIVRVSFVEGTVGPTHDHFHEQTTYIISGEYTFTIGDESFEVKAGDSVYMPPDVPHGCVCHKAGTILDIFTPIREDFLA